MADVISAYFEEHVLNGSLGLGTLFSAKGKGITTEASINKLLRQFMDISDKSNSAPRTLAKLIVGALNNYYVNEIKTQDKRAMAISAMEWIYGNDPSLAKRYEALTPEAKAVALVNTRGYIGRGQWEIGNKDALRLGSGGGSDDPFARIDIGAVNVQRMLAHARGNIMEVVFRIFDQMSEMSEKLNDFFANGLKEKPKAQQAVAAGSQAVAGAEEFAE